MGSRQSDEDMQKKIEELIEDESDPRERARLLILLAISRTLVDNVVAVREVTDEFRSHREEFDRHLAAEQAMLNQGRGAMRLAMAAIFLIQSVFGYVFIEHVTLVKALQMEVTNNTKEIAVIESKIK